MITTPVAFICVLNRATSSRYALTFGPPSLVGHFQGPRGQLPALIAQHIGTP